MAKKICTILHQFKFRSTIKKSTKERIITDLAESIENLGLACQSFFRFINRKIRRDQDDLEYFAQLDLQISKLGSCIREYEKAYKRFWGVVSFAPKNGKYPEIDKLLGDVDWVQVSEGVEQRMKKNLSQLKQEDRYYFSFSPFTCEISEGRLSDDLGQIYADMVEVSRAIEILGGRKHSDQLLIQEILSYTKFKFQYHTVRHLLEVEKVARWNAGLC